jgi:hypothetical protein
MAEIKRSDLELRLDAFERRRLTVNDLPLAALRRKLEADWQPEASVLLGSASITPEML